MFRENPKLITVRVFSKNRDAHLHGQKINLGNFDIQFIYGDFGDLVHLIIRDLKESVKYAKHKGAQIMHYIDYLQTGHFYHFEQSQIKWLQHRRDHLEETMGFHYIHNDPMSRHGEWFSFLTVMSPRDGSVFKAFRADVENEHRKHRDLVLPNKSLSELFDKHENHTYKD